MYDFPSIFIIDLGCALEDASYFVHALQAPEPRIISACSHGCVEMAACATMRLLV